MNIEIATAQDEAPGHYHPRMKQPRRSLCEKSRFSANARPAGWESLATAIIEQAILDYFQLVRGGAMRRGRIIAKLWTTPLMRDGKRGQRHAIKSMTQIDAEELVKFLKNADRYADAVELTRDWSDLWSQVMRLEMTGNYRGFLRRKGYENDIEDDEVVD